MAEILGTGIMDNEKGELTANMVGRRGRRWFLSFPLP